MAGARAEDGDWRVRVARALTLVLGAAVVALLGVAPARVARADEALPPAQVRLEMSRDEAASACPDQSQLEGAVAARLGYVPFVLDAPRHVRVHITGNRRGLQAELRVSDDANERVRRLDSRNRSCGDLTEALVLAISLAIDPLALTRPSPVAPTPTPVPPAPPVPTVQAPPTSVAEPVCPAPPGPSVAQPPIADPVPGPPPPSRLRVFASVAPHLVLGAEPRLSGGTLIAAGLRLPRASFGIELRFDATQRASVRPQGEVDVAMRGGGLVGCLHVGALVLCALSQVLAVQAQASGAPGARSAVGVLTTFGARAGVELRLVDWLWLRPAVELQVAANTVELVWLGSNVWQTARLQGLAMLAVGADL